MKKHFSQSKAFSLLETMIGSAILIMVFAAMVNLGVISSRSSILSRDRTEAYLIAQDAMEQIKGMRDWVLNNWSEASGGPTWARFWDDSSNINGSNNEFSEIQNQLVSNCVFIDHQTGNLQEASCSTQLSGLKFKRDITKDSLLAGNEYKVTVKVSWNELGQERSVVLVSYLTDYKPRY